LIVYNQSITKDIEYMLKTDPLAKEFVRMVKESGWKQREVARQLELTEGAVSHIMTGRNRPSPTVVRLFRLVLESEPGGTAGKSGAGREKNRLEDWEQGLLRKMRALKPAQRDRVLDVLNATVAALR